MARQKIAAGNWKMNTSHSEGYFLAEALTKAKRPADVQTIMAVPFTHLGAVQALTFDKKNISVAAQNFHHEEKGAYTGEISIGMLSSMHIPYALIGHSERREYQKESNSLLATKLNLALANHITPIFCCGEKLPVRKSKRHVSFVRKQLQEGLFHLKISEIKQVIIAYEPVWAIGTGETASPEQAQEMHAAIRKMLADKYNQEVADSISILYGGSVKPANAKSLFGQPDVDGGLVGGASLNAEGFLEIIHSF